jgi:hypothetical protein
MTDAIPNTYWSAIEKNLNELRVRLWELSKAGHADLALAASREAIGAAQEMHHMFGHIPSELSHSDFLRALPLFKGHPSKGTRPWRSPIVHQSQKPRRIK